MNAKETFAVLRRFSARSGRGNPTAEACDLCKAELAPTHRHLVEIASGRILCACDPCAWRFPVDSQTRFKLIPREARPLGNFVLNDAQWESLSLPINLAFFFCRSTDRKMCALYPSPAGVTESLLSLDAWAGLVANNPVLEALEPDVEALLVNRIAPRKEYYLAPIDRCYELAGVIRLHWRGFTGGDEVWQKVNEFFDRLQREVAPGRRPALSPIAKSEPLGAKEQHA